MKTVPVTAMIPAYRRVGQTLDTIERLLRCEPAPAEILVHIDARVGEMQQALQTCEAPVRVIESRQNLGPGGGRNRMLEAASHELVASFDDDSYPYDADFFERVIAWMERIPDAAILATNIFEPGSAPPVPTGKAARVADFVGCGCVYRRRCFLEAPGYVPIPIAYSMEEADLALRYEARERKVFFVPELRVYHDTRLTHHASSAVAAAQVANLGLFVYLRYPWQRWPLGLAQWAHKFWDTIRRRRYLGALRSFGTFLRLVKTYRHYRNPVSKEALDRHRFLRRSGGIPLQP